VSDDHERAIPKDDPLWRAAKRAPVYDGPVPEQERADVEAAIASGHFTDGATVTREIEARRVAAAEYQGETRPEASPEAIARIGARFEAADPKWHTLFAELKRRYPKA
jgi:hypothetical protein